MLDYGEQMLLRLEMTDDVDKITAFAPETIDALHENKIDIIEDLIRMDPSFFASFAGVDKKAMEVFNFIVNNIK